MYPLGCSEDLLWCTECSEIKRVNSIEHGSTHSTNFLFLSCWAPLSPKNFWVCCHGEGDYCRRKGEDLKTTQFQFVQPEVESSRRFKRFIRPAQSSPVRATTNLQGNRQTLYKRDHNVVRTYWLRRCVMTYPFLGVRGGFCRCFCCHCPRRLHTFLYCSFSLSQCMQSPGKLFCFFNWPVVSQAHFTAFIALCCSLPFLFHHVIGNLFPLTILSLRHGQRASPLMQKQLTHLYLQITQPLFLLPCAQLIDVGAIFREAFLSRSTFHTGNFWVSRK